MKRNALARLLLLALFLISCLFASAQDLSVLPEDLRIVRSAEGGYILHIRKKPDIASVLITETTRDPELREPNYTYRAAEYNTINGDERRILDGRFMDETGENASLYFLTDSTAEADPVFGEAFRIWIPPVLLYGFPGTRHGEVQAQDGMFLNIRAFEKPYADYSGAFADNPYRLKVARRAPVYMEETVETFSALADVSGGAARYAPSPLEIAPRVREILSEAKGGALDLVFAIDATESMQDDIEEVRSAIPALLEELLGEGEDLRVALVLYKDYFEDFVVRTACGFTSDIAAFSKALTGFSVRGGRDVPEAVYEAIDAALGLPWREGAERRIILIGDAPPHPKPRGRATRESVEQKAKELDVQVDAIILPHGAGD